MARKCTDIPEGIGKTGFGSQGSDCFWTGPCGKQGSGTCPDRDKGYLTEILQVKEMKNHRIIIFVILLLAFSGPVIPVSSIPSALQAGDILSFGSYEQDEILGADPIEWLVLTVENGRALLLSRYALETKPYLDTWKDTSWEDSALRIWLNSTFFNNAFTSAEKASIMTVRNSNPNDPDHGTGGGNDTDDNVFLLSIDEVKKYLPNDVSRQCMPTYHAIQNGGWTNDSGYSIWWLRSPGKGSKDAADVFDDGAVNTFGSNGFYDIVTVRPAVWADLTGMSAPAEVPPAEAPAPAQAAEIPEKAAAAADLSAASIPVPDGASEFNGHWYKIYTGSSEFDLDWASASSYCKNLGGHLVTITTGQEQAFIEELNASDNKLWIGGFRDSFFRWYWITGETWNYTNWDDGEPNNSSNVISNENRAALWPSFWNDLNENNTSEQDGFICEWEYTSEFTLGRDSNSFIHSSETDRAGAGFAGLSNYAIDDEYYERLTRNSGKGEKNQIKKNMQDEWTGSCYGIAMSMGLLYEGFIGIDDLTDSARPGSYYELDYPGNDPKLMNVINYYQLSQYLKNGGKTSAAVSTSYNNGVLSGLYNWFTGNDSLAEFLEKLVSHCRDGHTALLGFDTENIGHAVLVTGCDYDKDSNTYRVKIYDENSVGSAGSVGEFSYMTVAGDFSSFSYPESGTGANGEVVNEDTYVSIYFLDWNSLGDVISSGSSGGSGGTVIRFPGGRPFSFSTDSGEYLNYDGRIFIGSIPVYGFRTIEYGNGSDIVIETGDFSVFNVSGFGSAFEIDIYNTDEFMGFKGTNITDAVIDLKNGITLKGNDFEFEAFLSVDEVAAGENGLISVSAATVSDVSLTADGKNVTVSSDGSLTGISAGSYIGTDVYTSSGPVSGKSFAVGENAVIESIIHDDPERISAESLREDSSPVYTSAGGLYPERIDIEGTREAFLLVQTMFAETQTAYDQQQTLDAKFRDLEILQTEFALTQDAFYGTQAKTPEPAVNSTPDISPTAPLIPASTETPGPVPSVSPQPAASNTPEPAPARPEIEVAAGQIIEIGRWEQDNDTANGPEPVEWQVLAVENDRALLISRYGLDAKPYNEVFSGITWETSSLRQWLNNDFYNRVFTSSEKELILQVDNRNPDNPVHGTSGGGPTQDRIFLLSIEEADMYFMNDHARRCAATAFARGNGAYIYSNDNAMWWLRSPGGEWSFTAAEVLDSGEIDRTGYIVDYRFSAVRPAFWLDPEGVQRLTAPEDPAGSAGAPVFPLAAAAANTPRPTSTNTPRPTATNTPRPTAAKTPRPTATKTPRPTATKTPRPTATNTPRPTATNTPRPTATNTPRPTATSTPRPTATPYYYVGETVWFGRYEQDNNFHNGTEWIPWTILSSRNDRALLMSQYALEAKPFDSSGKNDWAQSSLRSWLNGEFYRNAFSGSERSAILTVSQKTRNEDSYYDNDTVFVLSYDEVETYLRSTSSRMIYPTTYARNLRTPPYTGSNGCVCWWTRTWYRGKGIVYNVWSTGRLDDGTKANATDKDGAVVPAVWVDLDTFSRL